jgi:hypothetical protein
MLYRAALLAVALAASTAGDAQAVRPADHGDAESGCGADAPRAGQGAELRRDADKLNAAGVPTAQGGRRWYPATVRYALAEAPAKR